MKRLENETMEEYRIRRQQENAATKQHLRGRWAHVASQLIDQGPGKPAKKVMVQGTKVKP